jgi:hypothetical protein
MASKGTKGFIYFCPELRLYRYKCSSYEAGEDGVPKFGEELDYKFDADELEDTLVALLASGEAPREAEAKFMADMTGLARINPHKVVNFDTGKDEISPSEPGPFWEANDKARVEKEEAEERASDEAK